jgi:hypothetical protein
MLSVLTLAVLTGCAGLPRAPLGVAVEDPPLRQRLLAAGPWAPHPPVTLVQRGILLVRDKEYVLTLYAHQDGDGIRQVVGCSELGASVFHMQGAAGQPASVVRNVSGLPDRLLRDGLWQDAALALPPTEPPLADGGQIRRQPDGGLVLAFAAGAGRLEWLYCPDAVSCRGARFVVGDRIHWQADVLDPPPPGSRVPRRWRVSHFQGIPYQIDLTLEIAGPQKP